MSEASQLDLCDIAGATERLGLLDYDQYYDWKKGKESTKAQPINPANPSFVIGSARITPLAQATAFATWANDGEFCENRALTSVTDSSGNKYKVKPVKCEQVMSPQVAADMNGTLKKIASQKVAKGQIGYPIAGKTGTNNGANSTWFVGYTTGMASAAWVGRYDKDQMKATQGVTVNGIARRWVDSGTWAAPLWTNYMKSVGTLYPANSLGRATQAPKPKLEPKQEESNSNDDSSNDDSSNDDSSNRRLLERRLLERRFSGDNSSPTTKSRPRKSQPRKIPRITMTNHMANTHRLASAVSRTARGAALAVGAAAAGAGVLIGYGMSETTRFGVREETLPLLAPGAAPIRILHLSDIHMVPNQELKRRWLHSLADLKPDLVINTGDNLGHSEGLDSLLDGPGPADGIPRGVRSGIELLFRPAPEEPVALPAKAHRCPAQLPQVPAAVAGDAQRLRRRRVGQHDQPQPLDGH